MSLRGTELSMAFIEKSMNRRARQVPWGSRGSAHTNKVAFQQIATSAEVHGFLAMTKHTLQYKSDNAL